MSLVIEGGVTEFIANPDTFHGLRQAGMVLQPDRVTIHGPHVLRSLTDRYEILPNGRIKRRVDRAGYEERDGQKSGELPPRVRGRSYPITISLAQSLGYVPSWIEPGLRENTDHIEGHGAKVADLVPQTLIGQLLH